jgi:hypothetical protein
MLRIVALVKFTLNAKDIIIVGTDIVQDLLQKRRKIKSLIEKLIPNGN